MDNPLVSVILPVRNAERFLAQALDSVVESEYRSFEIVVVDGASSDDTPHIAKSYDPVRFLSQSGVGLPDAWNTGIRAARGELISFIGADDIWQPNKMFVQVEYLTRHPDAQLVLSRVEFFQEPGSTLPPAFRADLLNKSHVGIMFETLMVRPSLFRSAGQLNPEYAITSDVDWFARVKDQGVPIPILPEVLVRKRVHEDNLSTLERVGSQMNQELLHLLKKSIERQRSYR